jgi:signal peptidase
VSSLRPVVVTALSWALLAAVVCAGIALIAVPKATDAKPLTILSGSMTGTHDVGDVVVVRPVDPDSLAVGDVITFQPVSDDPRLTTHRIDAVTYGSEGRRFVTRGDANGAADLDPVAPDQVVGEVWYAVPAVGWLSVWMAGETARTLTHVVALLLILYGSATLVRGLVERRRRAEPSPDDPQVLVVAD